MSYNGYFSHSFSLWGTAEDRLLYTKILLYPVRNVAKDEGGVIVTEKVRDPDSVKDFSWIEGTDFVAHNHNGNWSVGPIGVLGVGGSIRLNKGEVLTVWVGVYTTLSCLDGRAGTGKNELRVWSIHPANGQQVPGIGYSVFGDPPAGH